MAAGNAVRLRLSGKAACREMVRSEVRMLTSQSSPLLIEPSGHFTRHADAATARSDQDASNIALPLSRRYNAVTAAQTMRLRPHFPRLTSADAGLIASLLRRYDLDEEFPFLPTLLATEFAITAQAVRLRLHSVITKGVLCVASVQVADLHTSGTLRRIEVRILQFTELGKNAIRDAMAAELFDPATDSNTAHCAPLVATRTVAQSSADSSTQSFAQSDPQNIQKSHTSLMKYEKDREECKGDDFFEVIFPSEKTSKTGLVCAALPTVVEDDSGSFRPDGNVIVVTPSKTQRAAGATPKRLPLDFLPLLERGLSGGEVVALMRDVNKHRARHFGLSVQLLWRRFCAQDAAFNNPDIKGRRLHAYLNTMLRNADKDFVEKALADQAKSSEIAALRGAEARAAEYPVGSAFTMSDGRVFKVIHSTWVVEDGDVTQTQHKMTPLFFDAVARVHEYSSFPCAGTVVVAAVEAVDEYLKTEQSAPRIDMKNESVKSQNSAHRANQAFIDDVFASLRSRRVIRSGGQISSDAVARL